MKQRLLYGLLLCASLVIGGCASQPRLDSHMGAAPSGPELQLPGSGAEHAKLLAMGMARSKGWQIAANEPDRLLLERELPPQSPQAQKLSPDGIIRAPKLQVESRFREQRGDVAVRLSAYVITNPGTEVERRIDYTSDYQDALLISLNALANAWVEYRDTIASTIPLPPDPDVAFDAGTETGSEIAAETAREGTTGSELGRAADEPTAATSSAPVEPSGATTASRPAERAASSAQVALDPPELRRPAGRVRDEYATAAATNVDNNLVALDDSAVRGLWASFAEASARERGCEVGERGAVLLNTTSAFELYEVQCNAAQNLLLWCRGGVCRRRE
ncbi:MAG: hypothetical protein GVY22_06765 [Gammaproteobacteria bacterium]|nr:hypothetical protein [Gammaproteobacteria bacterium]